MRRGRAALALLAVLLAGRVEATKGKVSLREGMKMVRLLGTETAKERGVKPGPALSGNVHRLLVASGARVQVLPSGDFLEPGGSSDPISGLASAWGKLLLVRGRSLAQLDGNHIQLVCKLPYSSMRLASRGDRIGVLVYGGSDGPSTMIFHLLDDGTYEKLVEADRPITAVADSGGDVIFATGEALYVLPRVGKPTMLYRHAEPILSLASDLRTGMPFLASSSGVFAVDHGGAQPILGGATGFLHFDGEYLILSDPFARQVVAIEDPAAVLTGAKRASGTSRPAGSAKGGRTPPPPPTTRVLPPTGGLDFLK